MTSSATGLGPENPIPKFEASSIIAVSQKDDLDSLGMTPIADP